MSNLLELKKLTQELNDKDKELRENEQLLRLALSAADAVAWTWDIATNQVKGNSEFYKLFNCQVTNYEQFIECLHPDDIQQVHDAVQNSIKNGADYDVYYRIKCPGGWKNIRAVGRIVGSSMSGICIQETPCQCQDK